MISACGGTIEGTSGVLQTPGYPHGYPHRHICIWNIIGPVGRSVKLTFTDFDLEAPTGIRNSNRTSCKYDYVYVSLYIAFLIAFINLMIIYFQFFLYFAGSLWYNWKVQINGNEQKVRQSNTGACKLNGKYNANRIPVRWLYFTSWLFCDLVYG